MTTASYFMQKKHEVVAEVSTITGPLSHKEQDLVKLTYIATIAVLGLTTLMRESALNEVVK